MKTFLIVYAISFLIVMFYALFFTKRGTYDRVFLFVLGVTPILNISIIVIAGLCYLIAFIDYLKSNKLCDEEEN